MKWIIFVCDSKIAFILFLLFLIHLFILTITKQVNYEVKASYNMNKKNSTYKFCMERGQTNYGWKFYWKGTPRRPYMFYPQFSFGLNYTVLYIITNSLKIATSTDIICVINIIFHCLKQVVCIFNFFSVNSGIVINGFSVIIKKLLHKIVLLSQILSFLSFWMEIEKLNCKKIAGFWKWEKKDSREVFLLLLCISITFWSIFVWNIFVWYMSIIWFNRPVDRKPPKISRVHFHEHYKKMSHERCDFKLCHDKYL